MCRVTTNIASVTGMEEEQRREPDNSSSKNRSEALSVLDCRTGVQQILVKA
jgi:hypothetical protein